MSEESKKKLEKIKKLYETVKEGSDKILKEQSEPLGDKELNKKIKKVSEDAEQIVKHIEEKQ